MVRSHRTTLAAALAGAFSSPAAFAARPPGRARAAGLWVGDPGPTTAPSPVASRCSLPRGRRHHPRRQRPSPGWSGSSAPTAGSRRSARRRRSPARSPTPTPTPARTRTHRARRWRAALGRQGRRGRPRDRVAGEGARPTAASLLRRRASDANSTADVLIALNGAAPVLVDDARRHFPSSRSSSAATARPPTRTARFAFQDYGSGLVANDAATVQSLVALAGSRPPVAPGSVSSTTRPRDLPDPVPAPGSPARDRPRRRVRRPAARRLLRRRPAARLQHRHPHPGSGERWRHRSAVLGLTAAGFGSAQPRRRPRDRRREGKGPRDDQASFALAALATPRRAGAVGGLARTSSASTRPCAPPPRRRPA